MAARRLRLIGALVLAAAAGGCLQDDGARFNPVRERFETSVDEERELGFQFDREAATHLALVDDLPVLEFVRDLGQTLVAGVGSQPFLYRFRVIRDGSLNAFAVPGGFVYLHSGTVLAATSLDELAGVVGHEIAHVKARHYARMVEQAAIPNLLTGLAAVAATVATREPGVMVAAQAVNVALQLRYSREFESEADRLGANFMARVGYDPEGMVRFFERIVVAERASAGAPFRVPPYLYTHPDVKERIAVATERARSLRPQTSADPALAARLRDAQARLALLVEAKRSSWPSVQAFERSRTDPLLAEADAQATSGARDAALATLARAEAAEPADPRPPFRRAELLEAAGRLDEAIPAYRRAAELDPSRALVFFQLGRAWRNAGDPGRAIFYLEQAARRAAPGRGLRERALWEVEKLSFPVLAESGVAGSGDGPGARRDELVPADRAALWWGRLGPHFLDHRQLLRVRWIDPDGATALEEATRGRERVYAVSTLPFEPGARAGTWTVEALFDGDVIERSRFRLAP